MDREQSDPIDDGADPLQDQNPDMLDIRIDWVRDDPRYGAQHIQDLHDIRTDEVEEALFGMPPKVEAARHPDVPDRTQFWGSTRSGRWIFVVREDWIEDGVRYLRPLTAFEPDDCRAYWERR